MRLLLMVRVDCVMHSRRMRLWVLETDLEGSKTRANCVRNKVLSQNECIAA